MSGCRSFHGGRVAQSRSGSGCTEQRLVLLLIGQAVVHGESQAQEGAAGVTPAVTLQADRGPDDMITSVEHGELLDGAGRSRASRRAFPTKPSGSSMNPTPSWSKRCPLLAMMSRRKKIFRLPIAPAATSAASGRTVFVVEALVKVTDFDAAVVATGGLDAGD